MINDLTEVVDVTYGATTAQGDFTVTSSPMTEVGPSYNPEQSQSRESRP